MRGGGSAASVPKYKHGPLFFERPPQYRDDLLNFLERKLNNQAFQLLKILCYRGCLTTPCELTN